MNFGRIPQHDAELDNNQILHKATNSIRFIGGGSRNLKYEIFAAFWSIGIQSRFCYFLLFDFFPFQCYVSEWWSYYHE